MDNYYRQVVAWGKQQARQQEQERACQQRIDEASINAERERLRQEHLERARMYEAQYAGGKLASWNQFVDTDYVEDYFE